MNYVHTFQVSVSLSAHTAEAIRYNRVGKSVKVPRLKLNASYDELEKQVNKHLYSLGLEKHDVKIGVEFDSIDPTQPVLVEGTYLVATVHVLEK